MTIQREQDPRQLELDLIQQQFCTCAMYHSRFMEKPALELSDRVKLRELAKLYQDYREKTGLNEIIGKVPIVIPLEDWKHKNALERYDIINTQRAKDQARFTEAFIKKEELNIPGHNRLDVGASSCYFMTHMNDREHDARTPNLWFGIDVPDDRTNIARGTHRDRAELSPAFEEYTEGGVLPFKDIKFGLATMFYTLHHVDDKYLDPHEKNNVLRQVYDRLEPGGYLLVLEDNIGDTKVDETMYNFVKRQDDIFYPQAPGHQRTVREWHNILRENGFEVPKVGNVTLYNGIGIMTQDAVILARKPLQSR